jgi:hypothetical protein
MGSIVMKLRIFEYLEDYLEISGAILSLKM